MYFGTKSYLKSNHYHTPKHHINTWWILWSVASKECKRIFRQKTLETLHLSLSQFNWVAQKLIQIISTFERKNHKDSSKQEKAGTPNKVSSLRFNKNYMFSPARCVLIITRCTGLQIKLERHLGLVILVS
jgi:hypothetical protein